MPKTLHLTATGNLLIALAIGLAASSANCAEVSDCISQSNGALTVNSSDKCATVLSSNGTLRGQLTAAIGEMNARAPRSTSSAKKVFSIKSTPVQRLEKITQIGNFSPKQPNSYL